MYVYMYIYVFFIFFCRFCCCYKSNLAVYTNLMNVYIFLYEVLEEDFVVKLGKFFCWKY